MRRILILSAAALAVACGGGNTGTVFSGTVRGQTPIAGKADSDEGEGLLDGRRDPSAVIITVPNTATCQTFPIVTSGGSRYIAIYASAFNPATSTFAAPTEPGEFPVFSGVGPLPLRSYAFVVAQGFGQMDQTSIATSGSVSLTSAKNKAYTGSVNLTFSTDTLTGTFASQPCSNVSTFAPTVPRCDVPTCLGACGSVSSCQGCTATVKSATCVTDSCGSVPVSGGACDCGSCTGGKSCDNASHRCVSTSSCDTAAMASLCSAGPPKSCGVRADATHTCDCGTCARGETCGSDNLCHPPTAQVRKTGRIGVSLGSSNTLSADFLEYTPGTEQCTTADAGVGCTVRKCIFGSNPIGMSVYRPVGTVQATNGTNKISANPGSNDQYFALSFNPFASPGDLVNLSWDGGSGIPGGSLTVAAGAPVSVGGTTPLTISRGMARSFPISGGGAGQVVANLIQQNSSGNIVAWCSAPANGAAVTLAQETLAQFENGAASLNLSNSNSAVTTAGAFEVTGSVQSKISLADGGALYSLSFTLGD